MKWYETVQRHALQEKEISHGTGESLKTVTVTGKEAQTVRGFGGCFNELGKTAIDALPPDKRKEVFTELFTPQGLDYSFCRIPVGADDYALSWYSCDETDGDTGLECFSLERDRKYIIPYIKEAQQYHGTGMTFFASPWSPPSWMKDPPVYNYGRFRMEDCVLKAYAQYFYRFVEGYRKEGIDIVQLHPQNEPFADQKYPSCLWSAEDLRVFIRDYLGPLFEQKHCRTDIFLGTMNGPEEMAFTPSGMKITNYSAYIDTILFDDDARRFIKGVGYQWNGRSAIERTHECFPELEYVQTENECGDGRNTWEYAQYVFSLMNHYFRNGVTAYTYWNMVLAPGGKSTWGWNQNAMITVDPADGSVTYNPEFYVMKHFAHFIKPGAVRLETEGRWNSGALVFRNPDGTKVLVIQNALAREESMTLHDGTAVFTAVLAPGSFNTFVY